MKILEMREQWVHTHLILDRGTLTPEMRTSIDRTITPILRRHRIVYGYHVVEEPNRGISRLVIECVPLEHVQEEIREALAEAIAPFPSGPGRDTLVRARVEEAEKPEKRS